ncbi:MAG: type III pantothenate kinase [Spirochaetales bacterium]|nr:type III pantothenate kinase [Spirochaetales bacterium]
MLLAIDVGNTNIVFGVHDGKSWVGNWRIATVHSKMPDEYGVLFRDMLRDGGIGKDVLDKAIVSSVVPGLTGKMRDMVSNLIGKAPIIVGPGVKTGLKIRIGNPSELGTDIVCNCVAAFEKVQDSCIVVDFGTALTFTAIAANGEIRGVAIAPGLQSAAGALSHNTAQLPQVWLEAPEKAIGTNTTASIQSGVIFGYTGLVEHLIDKMSEELGGVKAVIGTGGLSGVIAPLTDRFTYREPWLILEGLRLIAGKN